MAIHSTYAYGARHGRGGVGIPVGASGWSVNRVRKRREGSGEEEVVLGPWSCQEDHWGRTGLPTQRTSAPWWLHGEQTSAEVGLWARELCWVPAWVGGVLRGSAVESCRCF